MSDSTDSSSAGDVSALEPVRPGDNTSPEDDSTDEGEEVDTSESRLQRLRHSLRSSEESKEGSTSENLLMQGLALMQIGEIHTERDQYGEAEVSFATAAERFRSLEGTAEYSHVYVETALRSLAHTYFQRRRYREAMDFFIDAQTVTRNSVSLRLETRPADNASRRSGAPLASTRNVSSRHRRRRSHMLQDVDTFLGAGVALTGQGELERALDALRAALRGYEFELGSLMNYDIAETLRHTGMVYELMSLPEIAITTYRETLGIYASIGTGVEQSRIVATIFQRIAIIEGSVLLQQHPRNGP